MKTTATCLVLLVAFVHFSDAFLCYQQEIGGSRSVVFCTNSCFSMGGSLGDNVGVKKGCADKSYGDACQAAGIPGLFSEHACFCNSFLCNSSSVPYVFAPLLLFSFLLQAFMG
ncbi:uncharacterized protein [Palaemon carinicauda]|uniref:uncharacterized protein n=1 Tax=Palaemon carinicauda TaxID=392227 RepID=UPI0035B58A60